jgi:hypothetical protein
MPALNVQFSEDELEGVRAAAAAEGKSVKQYLHDLAVREDPRQRFTAFAVQWGQQHRSEFDEAFPDEAPPADRAATGAQAA